MAKATTLLGDLGVYKGFIGVVHTQAREAVSTRRRAHRTPSQPPAR